MVQIFNGVASREKTPSSATKPNAQVAFSSSSRRVVSHLTHARDGGDTHTHASRARDLASQMRICVRIYAHCVLGNRGERSTNAFADEREWRGRLF